MATGQTRFSDVRCLVFDLDGTLIDSGLDLALSVNATVEKMGRAPLSHEQIFGYVGSGALRLVEAGRLVLQGESLATAAHAAGFSDQAHFSRRFSREFGFSPKGLWPVRRSQVL